MLMGLFEKVMMDEVIVKWVVDVDKCFDNGVVVVFVFELKIDGLAINLIYEKGFFVCGVMCGDGEVGEDVIVNFCMIFLILFRLFGDDVFVFVEVCGEVYMFLFGF